MEKLNGKLFRAMLENGSNNLANNRFDVDALNVFPVPDGDTGTNMHLTFTSGVKETHGVLVDNVANIAKVLSKGLLMGARGNSGVILSQIFRGFSIGVEDKEEVDALTLAQAFFKGSQIAYKAVMKPVEGTILTVIREAAEAALAYVKKNPDCAIDTYMEVLLKEAHKSLDHTPELLPILKEVGVVDSGGYGLITILEGFMEAIKGSKIELLTQTQTTENVQAKIENEEFGYCTEFIVRLSDNGKLLFEEEKLRRNLARIGDSLVVVQDEDLVKVHVHTMMPGDALNMAQRYGEFVKLKIENMQEQHEHLIEMAAPHKKYAIISVAAGQGLIDLFKDLRVDTIINGGQTMNPSTEDFAEAIKNLNADHIMILPNNSNIILAAQQVKDLFLDKDIIVIPTTTIPQGLSACMMFNPEVEIEENVNEMQQAMQKVVTGQITYAIKDTNFDGIKIIKDDFIGIKDKDIVVTNSDKISATKELIDKIMFEDAEIVTIIAGENATSDEVNLVQEYITSNYDVEADVYVGQQPVYSFIFGVE
ncbi:MAG: DAK2 domain-containing protein [Erysipelotrichaceae bacterium]|nr:DAK2 domain-containing protein [Erysipelotrichaceae bacterium]